MGKISFIHLSDIHFVKTSGNATDIDQDLREAVLLDLKNNARMYVDNIQGVLVSGDIAFSGNKEEYVKASNFLEDVTNALGIKESDVYCVPGNHDVDQSIPKISEPVYDAQCALDRELTLDSVDRLFHTKVSDPHCNSILFKTTDTYNEFASKYQCGLDIDKITWSHMFELDYGLKLNLHGMNSCFISNADDHLDKNDNRPMYVGQAQIPKRIDNTLCMVLCHHPPQCWKFQDQIIEKLNRRADIQLYGHKHTQIIEATCNNLIVYSGATHPTRGKDWNPRYNWLTLECLKEGDVRIVKSLVFPRVLDEYRDRFIPETNTQTGEIFFEHILNIDQKREDDLVDKGFEGSEENNIIIQEVNKKERVSRDMVFKLLNLPHIKQTLILEELELLEENEINIPYYKIIDRIIERAATENKINNLYIALSQS